MPSAFVAGRMAGLRGEDAFIDETHHHFTCLSDTAKASWSEELRELCGVPRSRLPRIVKPWDVIGHLIPRGRRGRGPARLRCRAVPAAPRRARVPERPIPTRFLDGLQLVSSPHPLLALDARGHRERVRPLPVHRSLALPRGGLQRRPADRRRRPEPGPRPDRVQRSRPVVRAAPSAGVHRPGPHHPRRSRGGRLRGREGGRTRLQPSERPRRSERRAPHQRPGAGRRVPGAQPATDAAARAPGGSAEAATRVWVRGARMCSARCARRLRGGPRLQETRGDGTS